MSCTSWFTWWLKKNPIAGRPEAPSIEVTEICPLTISRLLGRLDSRNQVEFALAYELIPMIFVHRPQYYVLPKEFILEFWSCGNGVVEAQIVADERVVMTQSFRKDSGNFS